MHIATAIQIFILLFWLVPAFRMWRARTKLNIFEELEDLSLDNNNEANSMVSIIVPIRNEEKRFQDAFKTLLNQTYPNFEVIAVNDRSTDRSKEILTELASSDPRVTAIHVENLPDGWLGKCNAMASGAKLAKGKYLLFTDADIFFHQNALSRAVGILKKNRADHLTVMPSVKRRGWLSLSVAAAFLNILKFSKKLWITDSEKAEFIGIGAFNLIERSVYKSFGGHERLRLEVADDMGLGYLVKSNGFKQIFTFSRKAISLYWLEDVWEIFRLMKKDSLSAFGYQRIFAILVPLFLVTISVSPLIVPIFWLSMLSFSLSLGIFFLIWSFYSPTSFWHPTWFALLTPLSMSMVALAWLAATISTIIKNGVDWRDTIYSIEELRKHMAFPRGIY